MSNEINKLRDFFFGLGYFSQSSLFVLVICLLIKHPGYIVWYLIGRYCLSECKTILNRITKQPRPSNGKKFLAWDVIREGSRNGMPSGHAASAIFDTLYLYHLDLVPIVPWICFAFFTFIVTVWERYYFRNHTVMQLFCGTILGIIVFYLTIEVSDRLCHYTGSCLVERRKMH